ncbi:MAG: choice-of-anchor D domain-containing protein [Candidatus Eisenbacteria bacterium]|uniref:Choice-of-anchor D domain-containing protein n=1 Tax=Eiseniibacteriota bacterium TaxID=2212470 RepID=A0A538TB22_UNCEI|nr:MAG: choice-of-anchor D domain-containing protein [Candidatus Eisenbacteria bacterium]
MSRARLAGTGAALLAALVICPPPAHALRVVTWNMFAYPDYNLAARQPYFRTVMANIGADVLVVQELNSDAGRDSFLTNVLNVVEPGQWASSAFFTLQSIPSVEGGAVFYNGPRDVLLTRVTPVGYTNINATFRVYSMHLKAGGPATVDSTTRRLECTDIRNTLNLAPANTNFLIGGDTNFYGAYEGGYIRLTESQADNDGRGVDPLNMPGDWHVIPGYAPYYSQCPCNTSCGSFSGGGLDDRFDLFLSSTVMQNGEGVDVVPGGYFAYGNDGNHFNTDVDGGGFNTAVGLTIATALKNASDHLPVVCTVQVASKIAAASQLDFGSVIVGATANQTLGVTDSAIPPADDLDYSFTAPAGFTVPAGSFSTLAGATTNHSIGLGTGSTGVKTGTLAISTDAPDSLTKNVLLSGRVLAHAVASLDSSAIVVEDSLDFGNLETGGFRDSAVAVHDRGYGALQARLSVDGAVIAGGGGRFSIAGGFSPALVAGTGRRYTLHFDDTGAVKDTTYEATLTFTNSDEPLPGATAAASLVVHLVARPKLGSNVGVTPTPPSALRFYPPRPNPLSRETRFAFDLPQSAPVSLEVYDVHGRLITRVVSGEQTAGHHEARWDAAGPRGVRLPAGLYIARLVTPGLVESRRLVLLP